MRIMMMAAALALAATPAVGQNIQVPAGLVNVTVGDVILENILSSNEIDILRNANILNGNNVAVPVAIAAAVCNIPVSVLAKTKSTMGGCTANADQGDMTQLARFLKAKAKGNN